MRVRTWLVGAAALALVGAAAVDVAPAQARGHGGHGGPGGGGAPSVSMHSGPSNFGGHVTTGAAPSTFGNRMGTNTYRGNFARPGNFNTWRGNTWRGTNFAANNWGWRGNRFRRGFRGRGFVGFGGGPYWGWDNDYAYSDFCAFRRPWDWRWRRWCGAYSWGYGPAVTIGPFAFGW